MELDTPIALLPQVWPLLVSTLFFLAVPDLMRPGLFFGVTVDPSFRQSDAGGRIRRRYSIAICVASAVAIAIALLLESSLAADAAKIASVLTILQTVAALGAFAWAGRAVRPHAAKPSSVIKADLSTRPESTVAIVAGLIVPIASLAVLAAIAAVRWENLPPQLAVHWSVAGPDRWVPTTPAAVATLLALNTTICLLIALLAWGVLRGSRRIATSGEAVAREHRFRMRMTFLLIASEWIVVVPAWAAILALSLNFMRWWFALSILTMLALLARLLLAGQGGSRGLATGSDTPSGDRMDDRYWTLGLVYFNRNDPAFVVEKRFGIGYTVNFAHPLTWTLITLLVAIPLIARSL